MQELDKLWLRETGEKEESSKCFKEQSLWEKKLQHSGAKILVKRKSSEDDDGNQLHSCVCLLPARRKRLQSWWWHLCKEPYQNECAYLQTFYGENGKSFRLSPSLSLSLSLSHVANLLHLLRWTIWCILKLEGSCCCGILSRFHKSHITTAGTKSISNLWVSLFQTHKKLLQLVQSQTLICSALRVSLFWPHKHFIPMAFAFWVAIHLWNHLSPRWRNMWRKLLHPHLLCRWAILITAFIIEESCATLFNMPKP